MSKNNNPTSSFILGLVLGTLTGAVVTLLTAPKSGEATREVIKEKSIELRERAATTAEDARSQAEHFLADTQERYIDIQHRGQELFDEQKKKLEKALEAGWNKAPVGVEPSVETAEEAPTPETA